MFEGTENSFFSTLLALLLAYTCIIYTVTPSVHSKHIAASSSSVGRWLSPGASVSGRSYCHFDQHSDLVRLDISRSSGEVGDLRC